MDKRELEAQQLSFALAKLDAVIARLYGPEAASVTVVVMPDGAWVMAKLGEGETIKALELALDQMRTREKQTFRVEDAS